MTDIPIVERLTREEQIATRFGKCLVNPDGPEAAALLKECVEALERARGAIASLPKDALGIVRVHPSGDADNAYAYEIRDELLAKIDATLAAMTKGEE